MINFASCPQCKDTNAQLVKFTWWGGVLGPKLLSHVKCQSCGKKYNGKTGGDNTTNIIIYSVVVGLVCFALVAVFAVAFVVLTMK
jgi:transposase-like protein